MPMSTAARVRLLALVIFASAMIGCQGFEPRSLPLVAGLFPNENVPAEILARYESESVDRISAIKRQGETARNATLPERQRIAQTLAQQIQREENPLLRQHLVRAVAICRTPLAGSVMRAALSDEDIDVQIEACRAWGRWGTDESVQVLGQVISNESAALDVKLAAATALAGSKQPGTVQALSVALEEGRNPALQHQAVQSLKEVTNQDLGNDVVAWRNFAGVSSQDIGPAPLPGGETNAVESFAKRALFWWK